jgi:hypothetical protein
MISALVLALGIVQGKPVADLPSLVTILSGKQGITATKGRLMATATPVARRDDPNSFYVGAAEDSLLSSLGPAPWGRGRSAQGVELDDMALTTVCFVVRARNSSYDEAKFHHFVSTAEWRMMLGSPLMLTLTKAQLRRFRTGFHAEGWDRYLRIEVLPDKPPRWVTEWLSGLELNEARSMLRSCPSFELLCAMCETPARLREGSHLDYIVAVANRPLLQCTVSETEQTMGTLAREPDGILQTLVAEVDDDFQKMEQRLQLRKVVSKAEEFQLVDAQRKVAMLLELTFDVPQASLHYWTADASGSLHLRPSEGRFPFRLEAVYGMLRPDLETLRLSRKRRFGVGASG